MHLTAHLTTPEELKRCRHALAPHYGDDPELMACLPDVWQRLIWDGTAASATIEDQMGSSDRAAVALGASVFVSDAFLQELENDAPPFPSAQVMRRILAGRSPILSPEAARRAHAREGLNVLILHECFPTLSFGVSPSFALKEKLASAFFEAHCGYRVKAFAQQALGEEHRDWFLMSGLRLRRDYADHYLAHPQAPRPAHGHPYLMGLTRTEAEETPGVRAYTMFVYTPAQFGFTAKEQALLRHALKGETDEELAQSLDLSLSMVKKRWCTIYDQVMATASGLLSPGAGDSLTGTNGPRGVERRRHLLNYLREHPEELQPVSASKRMGWRKE